MRIFKIGIEQIETFKEISLIEYKQRLIEGGGKLTKVKKNAYRAYIHT